MKKYIIFILLCSLCFIGCNSTSKKKEQQNLSDDNIGENRDLSDETIREGKVALASKEYDKAKGIFKLIISEDDKNNEAKKLYDLAIDYLAMADAINNNDYTGAQDYLIKLSQNKYKYIIEDDINKIIDQIEKNKELNQQYQTRINEIEKSYDEGNIDQAKNSAQQLLVEVSNNKEMTDEINGIISKIDDGINKAKSTIENYTGYTVHYSNNIRIQDDGLLSEIQEMSGQNFYHFYQDQECSPKECYYNINTNDIFELSQGIVTWINNNNMKSVNGEPFISEDEYKANNTSKIESNNKQDKMPVKDAIMPDSAISPDKAKDLTVECFLNDNPNFDQYYLWVSKVDVWNEKYYYIMIAAYTDEERTHVGRPLAEYYVNAISGEVIKI